jgi:hypothetical protein
MVRVVRSRSRTPTRVSNRPIARPTPDDVRPSASAARAIDPGLDDGHQDRHTGKKASVIRHGYY